MWLVIIRIGSYEVRILQDGVGVVNASSYILYLYVCVLAIHGVDLISMCVNCL